MNASVVDLMGGVGLVCDDCEAVLLWLFDQVDRMSLEQLANTVTAHRLDVCPAIDTDHPRYEKEAASAEE